MNRNAIYQKIASVLQETDEKLASASTESIEGKHLIKDVGLDSLDVIKFILGVEEQFGIKIADDDIDTKELLQVDNLASYIAARTP